MKIEVTLILSLFMGLAHLSPLYPQTQLGLDIDGEAAHDESGFSVSLSSDGNTIAIGSPRNEDNGREAGSVRVFEWEQTQWKQKGSDIDGETAGDESGIDISISADGNVVAIGAFYNGDNGLDAGHVRVYEWKGGQWIQKGEDIDGEAAVDLSGAGVSLSSDGNIVAVGAPGNSGNGVLSGHVRVFGWNGSQWMQMGEDVDGEAADDLSGAGVSLSSDGAILAVGASWNDGNGLDAGHVRVYEWNGAQWIQRGEDIDGEAAGDHSGAAVSLSSDGNTLAIGAWGNLGNVKLYEWNGVGWIPKGEDIPGEMEGDAFGFSVSLSSDGNRVAIGAPQGEDRPGYSRVYSWVGGAWSQLGADIAGEAEDDFCGFGVSLSSDGQRVAVGAYRNDGNGEDAGHVRVFDLRNTTSLYVIKDSDIEIFPNPTQGVIHLVGIESATFTVLDNLGQVVLIGEILDQELNLSQLASGVYFLHVDVASVSHIKMVIKL